MLLNIGFYAENVMLKLYYFDIISNGENKKQ